MLIAGKTKPNTTKNMPKANAAGYQKAGNDGPIICPDRRVATLSATPIGIIQNFHP